MKGGREEGQEVGSKICLQLGDPTEPTLCTCGRSRTVRYPPRPCGYLRDEEGAVVFFQWKTCQKPSGIDAIVAIGTLMV